jgi:hypothetical protein
MRGETWGGGKKINAFRDENLSKNVTYMLTQNSSRKLLAAKKSDFD